MTDFSHLDRYWEQLRAFLSENYGATDHLIVPAPLDSLFPQARTPQQAADGEFEAIVIHKGDYTAFDPDLLYRALIVHRPVFANEVFIVLAAGDSMSDPGVDEAHVGALKDMRSWARRHASPDIVAAHPNSAAEYAPADALARMARLIIADLVKPITGTSLTTVAETAQPFGGSRWFWGDDAAKVAELFCLPQLRAMAPGLVEQLIDMMLALSPASIIRRRIGPVELHVEKEFPDDFRILSPFTITFGDLSRGQVRQAVRFNDGRTRPLVCHAPGTLSFGWRGERHVVDLTDAICASAVEPQGDGMILRHVASIRRPDDVGRELASVHSVWTLDPGRNALFLDMTLRPARFVTLRDVVLTSALRELDEIGTFNRITATTIDADAAIPANWSASGQDPIALPCPDTCYAGFWEGNTLPGHAIGLHIVGMTNQIEQLRLRGKEDRLVSVELEHRRPKVSARATFSVREARLLTAGGYYDKRDEYEALVREDAAQQWCQDPSMTYDTGVELNAVATWLFFAQRDRASHDAASDRSATMRSWFDRHLGLYLDHVRPGEPRLHERIFVRGLAFVILSLDVMQRCFPEADYGQIADLLTGLLRKTEIPIAGTSDAGIFSNGPSSDPSRPELDSQGAALLALARRAHAVGPDEPLSAAIERGLMALRIAIPRASTYGNDPLDHETLVIGKTAGDDELIDTGFWTYKIGLALRAFAVIEGGCAIGKIRLSEDARAHMSRLRIAGRDAALRAAVDRGESIEILTSHNAGETNSETQPWVAMGLVPLIEQELLGLSAIEGERLRISA